MGCALNYLFRPREEVLDLVRDNHRALQDTSALKIGIQACDPVAVLHCMGVYRQRSQQSLPGPCIPASWASKGQCQGCMHLGNHVLS